MRRRNGGGVVPVYFRDFAYPNTRPALVRMASDYGNMGEQSAASFAELLSGPLVDFYIGTNRGYWSVHLKLLCYHSSWFAHELSVTEHGRRGEAPTKGDCGEAAAQSPLRLELPQHSAAGFVLLVKCLYQGNLDSPTVLPDPLAQYEHAVACHGLYLLCYHFEMPLMMDLAMDSYRQSLNLSGLVPDAEELCTLYGRSPRSKETNKGTPERLGTLANILEEMDPFRKLMIKIAARQIMAPETVENAQSYQRCFEGEDGLGFAVALVNAIRDGSGAMLFDDPTEPRKACEYHGHAEGEACLARRKSKGRMGR
ncbi:hypothetical protein P152DRAFT_60194 [Eremomyces bilateralis CBS 781.70]|uniref:BTB domain-containing protein n=1 Tax=Eremomyces bilateralis CBS 781.70 TaxID=1392243 RepID=A0A6G1G0W5_9PEZI|nr:uncharacterized protein P152DRAFT_60194 [Eremomyces bilateralis CBS 781.70]KAF1811571.1 hypothetical protein P152DRAFT_60194 [Eremomyces bilateralis CBS 781.70]